MSIELMTGVWKIELSHSQQSVLLAMADFANDDGRNCYPSHRRLAWKTGYSERQVARIINGLVAVGIVQVIKLATNNQPPRYWIRLDKGTPKPPFENNSILDDEIWDDILSPQESADTNRGDKMSTPNNSRGDKMSTRKKARGDKTTPPDVANVTPRGDIAMSPDPSVPPIEPSEGEEEEEALTHDPVAVAWIEHYGEPMTEKLQEPINGLVIECGPAAVIHAIAASAEARARTFRYIAECARNYIPPAKQQAQHRRSSQKNERKMGYSIGAPTYAPVAASPYPTDVEFYPDPPAAPPTPPAAKPVATPVAPEDFWAVALRELKLQLPSGLSASSYFDGSTCVAAGEVEVNGGGRVPLYQVQIKDPAGMTFVGNRCGGAIRRVLKGVIGTVVQIEVVCVEAAEMEMVR